MRSALLVLVLATVFASAPAAASHREQSPGRAATAVRAAQRIPIRWHQLKAVAAMRLGRRSVAVEARARAADALLTATLEAHTVSNSALDAWVLRIGPESDHRRSKRTALRLYARSIANADAGLEAFEAARASQGRPWVRPTIDRSKWLKPADVRVALASTDPEVVARGLLLARIHAEENRARFVPL